jgi:hypothetical protein
VTNNQFPRFCFIQFDPTVAELFVGMSGRYWHSLSLSPQSQSEHVPFKEFIFLLQDFTPMQSIREQVAKPKVSEFPTQEFEPTFGPL